MTAQIKGYNSDPNRARGPGQRFHMDYGFVRGKSVTKGEDGPLISSKDGYICYLLIADEYSRHLWVFLFAGKNPPIDMKREGWGNSMDKYKIDNGDWLRATSS